MQLEAWLFALSAAFIFGLALNATQIGLRHLPAALGSVVSIPTACVMFWLSSPWTADFSGWRTDAVAMFALIGMFYPALITIITFEATKKLGPNITASLGVLWLGEVLAMRQLAGIAVIILGATMLTSGRSAAGANWPLWALALPLTASFLRGLGQPLFKIGFSWWHNPRVATLICYACSATVVITVGLWRTRGTDARFSPKGVAWFMLIGVGNGIATWCGIEAVSRGPVSMVAPVVASYPLFTLLIGMVMFRRARVSPAQAAGVALTVGGVMMLLIG
jgi:drug/metabolite transporter (DMT)-like permease